LTSAFSSDISQRVTAGGQNEISKEGTMKSQNFIFSIILFFPLLVGVGFIIASFLWARKPVGK
jgi:hypothetical protein